MRNAKITFNAIVTSLALLAAYSSYADMRSCGVPNVTVNFQQTADGELVCGAVRQATMLFDKCNLPRLSRPIRIAVVEDLSQGYVATYRRGDDMIEALSASRMQERRDPNGTFSYLTADDYFQSVVVHELSHAAADPTPCPFEACIVADEYIAYAMQVMSLGPEAQQVFENRFAFEDPVSAEELSVVLLFMAPHLFSQKVWAHLSQRDDPCSYIGQLMDRSLLLDRERF
jgi:hypothetical protein